MWVGAEGIESIQSWASIFLIDVCCSLPVLVVAFWGHQFRAYLPDLFFLVGPDCPYLLLQPKKTMEILLSSPIPQMPWGEKWCPVSGSPSLSPFFVISWFPSPHCTGSSPLSQNCPPPHILASSSSQQKVWFATSYFGIIRSEYLPMSFLTSVIFAKTIRGFQLMYILSEICNQPFFQGALACFCGK